MTGEQAVTFISAAQLKELAASTYSQPVVSVYLKLTPDVLLRQPRVYLTVFNSMRHRELANRRGWLQSLPGQQRHRLQVDLDEIEGLLQDLDPAGARSLVIFRSGEELRRLIRLPVRTVDSLTIDADPYIKPLLAALEDHPRALVVEVSKEEARFWSEHLGQLEEIESRESFVPTDTVDRARPGKVQRHRLTHLRWHLKTTAQLTDRLSTEGGFDLLILSGDENVLVEFERLLPGPLRGRVAARLHPSPHEDRGEWQRQIEQVLVDHRRAEEEAQLARLGEYQDHDLLVSGLPGALDVANRFLVRKLFVSSDLTVPGHVCPEHHFLSLDGGRCPFCEKELLPAGDVVDELIELARLHGVEVWVIEQMTELLGPHGGVAAVTYELRTE